VPPLIAAVSEADQPWLAMDFIHGPSRATMISQREPFTVGPYAALGLALVEALRAIHGAGAFRNFRDTVRRHCIESGWFAFRAEALRQIAVNWCEENHIVWE
jgi:hypothetical protein